VFLRGIQENLWFCGHVPNRQHEAELSEMSLRILDEGFEVKRLQDVDPDFRPDAEIHRDGRLLLYWEHEASGSLNLRQLRNKIERYGDRPVLWTCRNGTYLDKVARLATSDRHLFTTTELAMVHITDDVWVDRLGTRSTFSGRL
jgi:hypothetical protein